MHCDLKPANVLLKSTASNSRGFTCKLCDFGMSRLLDVRQATHVSTLTYGVSLPFAIRAYCWHPVLSCWTQSCCPMPWHALLS